MTCLRLEDPSTRSVLALILVLVLAALLLPRSLSLASLPWSVEWSWLVSSW